MPSIPSIPSFRRARLAIEVHGDQRGSIRTLPELVEFNAENNPEHLFCLQANKIGEPTSITHLQLKHAILRCSSWLRDHVSGFREPEVRDDGKVLRAAPIALFMESDAGIFVFFLSLMAAGVPVSTHAIKSELDINNNVGSTNDVGAAAVCSTEPSRNQSTPKRLKCFFYLDISKAS